MCRQLWQVALSGAILGAGAMVIPIPLAAEPNPPLSGAVAVVDGTPALTAGMALYRAGQFQAALDRLQAAVRAFQQQRQATHQAIALNYIALAYQQQGEWSAAATALQQSLALLSAQTPTPQATLAQALTIQGQQFFGVGQPEQALLSWQKAYQAYDQSGDEEGRIGSLMNQAQALQSLGQYRRALQVLERSYAHLHQSRDRTLQTKGFVALGNTLQWLGRLTPTPGSAAESLTAQPVLDQALRLAQTLNNPELEATVRLSLGQLAVAQDQNQVAHTQYQRAEQRAITPLTRLEARFHKLRLAPTPPLAANWHRLIADSQALPISRTTLTLRLQILRHELVQPQPASTWHLAAAELVRHAQALGDRRMEALALGTLAERYTQTQQWSAAEALLQRAISLAEALQAPEIAYRLYAQQGRLLIAQPATAHQTQAAIAAYQRAVTLLQRLRTQLVALRRDAQFNFQQEVEPIYRELVSLLLSPADKTQDPATLEQARQVMESLQLAELDNFFRRACLDRQPVVVDRLDRTTAVLYPILLRDRLELIVSLPSGTGKPVLRRYTQPVAQATLEATVDTLRRTLVTRTTDEFMSPARTVYDWLIRPLERDLQQAQVQTLVFVLDGSLRNIPMAALHNGQSFLSQTYRLALTPGLQLLSTMQLTPAQRSVIAAGISTAHRNWPALPYVSTELKAIDRLFPSRVLLNQGFTSRALQQNLATVSAPIVHLATHGQFSSQAESTYIATWDRNVTVNELSTYLLTRETSRSVPIDLLILSACRTATGDRQATLGMAGIAVRSGARSTLATLWQVDDEATAQMMTVFYEGLAKGLTKAEALGVAQRHLWQNPQYQHPFYWASYVLIGHW